MKILLNFQELVGAKIFLYKMNLKKNILLFKFEMNDPSRQILLAYASTNT